MDQEATKAEGPRKRVRVVRHELTYRIFHWTFFVLGVILTITGLEIGGIFGNLPLIENVGAIHSVLGLALTFVLLAFFYYFIVSGEYHWYRLRRIPLSLKFFIMEAKAWLGIGPHVEEPILYDDVNKRYVEKIIPTEVMVWWGYVGIGTILIITGLILMFPESMGFLFQIFSYAFVRSVHRFMMYVLVTVVIMHAYAAYVFGMLRAITFGDREELVKA
ncbi:MAG: cytochrome b/b6 domain-containing protein [Nitrososphaerota archaeon]|nr:cytochrome b/b6 domain-containing protein [Nitrososphaerales archaeon]MDW8044782.1 cytochrome b/b6 domain-containing protein [Nitrososphaerota archaeon]